MDFYGQFREDEKLRELIGEKNPGFYIDVGAWHPDVDSVTKHFYDCGWSGVNIEPVSFYYDLLVQHRQRDVNLNIAVDGVHSLKSFYRVEDSGLSTFRTDYAQQMREDGRNVEEITVTTMPLQEICRRYVRKREIDFLKIDVEGWELAVLHSNDWKRFRPNFIVAEATVPCTEIPTHQEWEDYLMARGYEFVSSDRVNRFYRDQLLGPYGCQSPHRPVVL